MNVKRTRLHVGRVRIKDGSRQLLAYYDSDRGALYARIRVHDKVWKSHRAWCLTEIDGAAQRHYNNGREV